MRRFHTLVLALSLSLGASAFAANERRHKPSEYQDITDEDRAAARERARNRMGSWHEVDPIEESTFPWMQLGFTALAFAIVAPFAYWFFKNSSKELNEANAFANSGPKKRVPRAATPAPDAEE